MSGYDFTIAREHGEIGLSEWEAFVAGRYDIVRSSGPDLVWRWTLEEEWETEVVLVWFSGMLMATFVHSPEIDDLQALVQLGDLLSATVMGESGETYSADMF